MDKRRDSMWNDLGELFSRGQLKHCRIQTSTMDQFSKCFNDIKVPGADKQVFVLDSDYL